MTFTKPLLKGSVFFILAIAVVWLVTGPKKKLTYDEGVILYRVFYVWDGEKEPDPAWRVYRNTQQKWLVIDAESLHNALETGRDTAEFGEEFNWSWITKQRYRISAQGTRWEALLTLVGFKPLFKDEEEVFARIFEETKTWN